MTILLLRMGLGMSAGLGAFAVAGLVTAFLCPTLAGLSAQLIREVSGVTAVSWAHPKRI